MREQLPETAMRVVSSTPWRRPGSSSRLGFAPAWRTTNASTRPLVSPPTRFEAAERNPIQRGRAWKPPETDGAHDGAFAGAPLTVRETSFVGPACHGAPLLPIWPRLWMAKTSVWPLVSFATRLDASD